MKLNRVGLYYSLGNRPSFPMHLLLLAFSWAGAPWSVLLTPQHPTFALPVCVFNLRLILPCFKSGARVRDSKTPAFSTDSERINEAARGCTSAPRALPRITARVPADVGARTRGGGGLCSLLLSLLSDPSGSSDSLHSGSVTPRLLSPSLPVVCQCLSLSSPALSPLALLSGLFPQKPAKVPPGRRFCPTRADCRNLRTAAYQPARSPAPAAWTHVPPPSPPPLPPPLRGRPRPYCLSPSRLERHSKSLTRRR